ncbi:hypothetical protein ACIA8F_36290 [Streptomyces sp. NPDC051563]|uniref:hypothetical protein n=1 Tax=Streptomyces sp. NPDC051563 TaxID=3365659 RepID=UPI00378F8B27
MTTRRMYFATAALSALALGVAVASGWGQDFPDGDRPAGTTGATVTTGTAGTSGTDESSRTGGTRGTTHVEANVQHADATPRPSGDVTWN